MNPILIRSLRWVAMGVAGLVLALVFALACTFVYLAPSLHTKETMNRVTLTVPLRVYSRTGGLIDQIGEQRRIPLTPGDIPPLVRQAVLAAEDAGFFEHSGFEWKGIVRALLVNVATAEAGQGGSTISQQTARNMYLNLDKTLRRKLSEVFLTWRMERDLDKEQILASYLTVIFFGQRSYGIAAAAETYFGKRLADLTVAEAATLAGIIQLPSRQNPISDPKAAESRRAYVLRRMTELGYIDAATAAEAAKEPIVSRGFAPLRDVEAPYVAEMARQEIVSRFGEAAVNAGYRVYTTLDDRAQSAANRAVRLGLLEDDQLRRGYRGHLGKIELPATSTEAELDQRLAEFPTVNVLEPAVVTAVAATSAEVHVRGRGKARIPWSGLSWARRALRNGTGPAPRTAADVVARGDVIHVVTDGRGNAQLAQVPQVQAALVAIDPIDGAIVSLVGGFDYYTNQFNRVKQANRQPGSGFKPFLYSAALDHGYTAATLVNDAPVMVDHSGEENWRPENSGGQFLGPIRLRRALALSRNTVSIRILQDIGVNTLIEHAGRIGFDGSALPRNLTLALGSQTTTPEQMAAGFAVFANGGFKVTPYFIERIEDATGNVVYEAAPAIACAECELNATGPEMPPAPGTAAMPEAAAPVDSAVTVAGVPDASGMAAMPGSPGVSPGVPAGMDGSLLAAPAERPPLRGMERIPESMRELASVQGGRGFLPEERLAPRVLSAQNAWLMNSILHDVTTSGTAQRTRTLGRDDLAGKTGTTNDNRDNWFNGYTHNLVASVWVGYDDYQSLGSGAEGSTTAVPIWIHYMREALRGVPPTRLPRPEGLVDIRVSPLTGKRAHPLDANAIVETFMIEHLPEEPGLGEGFSPEGEAEGPVLRF